jgi:tRNA pseudouridine38-40 synthase
MGSLINVGLGLKENNELAQALNTTDYVKAGFIAPGSGLYLNKVDFIRDPFKGLKSKKKVNEEAK